MFSFGKKIADRLESGSRFGQKMLGSVARFGNKAASTIQAVKKGVADVPVIGAVADIPIYKGVSANQAADMASNALNRVAEMAGKGDRALKAGDNIIRAGRALGAAGNAGERIAAGKDMITAGQSMRQNIMPSAPAPPQIQKP
jgi:hypothetical protein